MFLSIWVRVRCIFSTQIAFISSRKPPGQRIFSLFNVFDILSHQVFRKIDKNCIKFSKLDFFCIFVSFGQNLMHFLNTNCFYLQIASISSRKPPGQRIFSLFNVFYILSHQVFRKIDKNCIKFSKLWIFEFFCHFGSEFEAFFHFFEKASWITIFFSLDCFKHSKPRNSSIIWQKWIKVENCAVFITFGVIFGSFWGLWGQPKMSKNLDKYIPLDTNFTSVEFNGWKPLARIYIYFLATFVKNNRLI